MIVLVPFITSPYLLGLTFFLLGVTYGVVDSCTVLIIQVYTWILFYTLKTHIKRDKNKEHQDLLVP